MKLDKRISVRLMLTFATTSILVLSAIGLWIKFKPIENGKTAVEWVKMAVEEEHYILDDGGILLTHTAVIQTPSLELVEEAEGETYGDYLYFKDNDGDYYEACFKHYLIVEKYSGKIEEYVYISAIAWKERSSLKRSFNNFFGINPKENKIYQWQIQDIDIAKVVW